MLISCWSVKGGVGTTVVATCLALALARRAAPPGALLVDLGGDVPHALGLAEPVGPGLVEWMGAGPHVPPDALARLSTEAGAGLHVLHRGTGTLGEERADVLASLLAADPRAVVVDAGRLDAEGRLDGGCGRVLAAASPRSLLVVRPCQLALFRARHLPVAPTGVVVVREPARALTVADVERVVGVPVVAELAVDPAVARAVDAGLLAARLPRSFAAAVEAIR